MSTAKLTIGIDDEQWPKVTVVIYTETETVRKTAGPTKFTYDLSYTAAENMVHNELRSMFNEVLKKHGK